jgi:hypothetical protein
MTNGEIMSDVSPEAKPLPNEELVKIFDTEQESEALIVRGLLESAGIDADITSLDASQEVLPGVGGTVILVRAEDAERAKSMIEEYRRAPDASDSDITEELAP